MEYKLGRGGTRIGKLWTVIGCREGLERIAGFLEMWDAYLMRNALWGAGNKPHSWARRNRRTDFLILFYYQCRVCSIIFVELVDTFCHDDTDLIKLNKRKFSFLLRTKYGLESANHVSTILPPIDQTKCSSTTKNFLLSPVTWTRPQSINR